MILKLNVYAGKKVYYLMADFVIHYKKKPLKNPIFVLFFSQKMSYNPIILMRPIT